MKVLTAKMTGGQRVNTRSTSSTPNANVGNAVQTKVQDQLHELKTMISKLIDENNIIKEKLDGIEKLNNKLVMEVQQLRSKSNNEILASGEIKKILQENIKKPLYADQVKRNNPVVIVKPKDISQKAEVTKKVVKENINPISSQIHDVRKASKGAIIMECKDNEATEKLRNETLAKLGENYVVSIPQQKFPKIKIVNMSDLLNEETIVDYIRKQNDFLDENAKLEVVKINQKKVGKYVDYMAILETDSSSFSKIMEKQQLNVGWDRCKVYEHVQVHRCFKCNGFNHNAKDCTKNQCCGKCASDHETKECKSSEFKCINCISAVQSLKMNIDVEHTSFSKDCAVLNKMMEIERKKVNFEK